MDSIPTQSPSQWVSIGVIGVVVAVSILFQLPRFLLHIVRETIWIPWSVARQMRRRGYPGPTLRLFKNYSKEMQELAAKAPSEPLLTSTSFSHDIESRIMPNVYAFRKIYGDKFVYRRGSRVHLHSSDPEVIKEILASKFDEFEKCSAVGLPFDILGPKGLFYSEHEEWARQRRVVRPAFYSGRTKDKVGEIASWIEIWLQKLDNRVVEHGDSVEIDVLPEVAQLTKDILARTAFGSSFEKGKECFEHLEKHKNLLQKIGIVWNPLSKWIPTQINREMSKARRDVLRCLREIIRDRRKSIDAGNYESYGDDFLGRLLADRDRRLAVNGRPPGERETEDDQLTDQCRTFFFAGAESVQMTVCWAIVCLSFYSDWQDRIRAEEQQVLQDALPDGAQLAKLKQVAMFVEETLRLYGPAPALAREVYKSNTTLQGETLPKHLAILVNFCALHRDKENWGEDALEFKPERFSDGVAKALKRPISYSPFGWGPRICVAQPFALIEVKLIVAMFVRRFSFRLSPSYRHEPVLGMALFPKFGVQVVLENVQPATA